MRLFKRKKRTISDSYRQPRAQENQRVFSYYTASRRQLDTFERQTNRQDPLRNRAQRQIRAYWFLALCIVSGVAITGWMLTLSNVAYVRVEGPSYRQRSTYAAAATQAIQGDWRNRWKLLLRSESIRFFVLDALPEAKAVEVRSTFLGRKPEIIIYTDAPLAWFDQPNAPSVLLSERGKLLLPEMQANNPDPQFSRSVLPGLRNETGVKGEKGKQFLSPEEATALNDLMYQIQQDNDPQLPQLTLTSVPREVELHEPDRGGYAVRMLLNNTIREQYGALRATQKQLTERGQNPAEYIDVRLVDRVYIK